MNKLFLVLALLLISVSAASQPMGADAARPLDIEAERSRIQAERAREEALYGQEEAACYARFSVTNCLGKVRVRRREVLDDLRRQEVLLNDAERTRKALEQMERLHEKSSAQRMEEETARRREVREAQQEREERARQKASAAIKAKTGQASEQRAEKPVEPGRTADDLAIEQKQYQEKLREAQEHRASREKSNREKSGTPAKPLPVSP